MTSILNFTRPLLTDLSYRGVLYSKHCTKYDMMKNCWYIYYITMMTISSQTSNVKVMPVSQKSTSCSVRFKCQNSCYVCKLYRMCPSPYVMIWFVLIHACQDGLFETICFCFTLISYDLNEFLIRNFAPTR